MKVKIVANSLNIRH